MSNIAVRRWKHERWKHKGLSGRDLDSQRLAAQQPHDHPIDGGRRNWPDGPSIGRINAIRPGQRVLFYGADLLRQLGAGVQYREREEKTDSGVPYESADLVRPIRN